MLKQKHNEEQKADVANSQPAYCKTDVTGRISSNDNFDKYEIKSWHITILQTVVVLNFLVLLTLLILEITVPSKSQKRQSKSQTSTNK